MNQPTLNQLLLWVSLWKNESNFRDPGSQWNGSPTQEEFQTFYTKLIGLAGASIKATRVHVDLGLDDPSSLVNEFLTTLQERGNIMITSFTGVKIAFKRILSNSVVRKSVRQTLKSIVEIHTPGTPKLIVLNETGKPCYAVETFIKSPPLQFLEDDKVFRDIVLEARWSTDRAFYRKILTAYNKPVTLDALVDAYYYRMEQERTLTECAERQLNLGLNKKVGKPDLAIPEPLIDDIDKVSTTCHDIILRSLCLASDLKNNPPEDYILHLKFSVLWGDGPRRTDIEIRTLVGIPVHAYSVLINSVRNRVKKWIDLECQIWRPAQDELLNSPIIKDFASVFMDAFSVNNDRETIQIRMHDFYLEIISLASRCCQARQA